MERFKRPATLNGFEGMHPIIESPANSLQEARAFSFWRISTPAWTGL